MCPSVSSNYLLALMLCFATIPSPSYCLTVEEDLPAASAQDTISLFASLQQMQPEEGFNRNELRRLANMYEMMQQVQRSAELEERQREEAEELPLALPLTGGLLPREKYIEDKRGSYMSLCHFKICNMGRKRSQSWN